MTARVSRGLCGAFFVGAGILHFVRPKMYEEIVPPGFGDPPTVVLISGAAEIVGGLSLAASGGRRLSRWWLVGLLVAVFPANVYMALEPQRSGLPGWLLWARLPLQPLVIWWVWAVTRRSPRRAPTDAGDR
ncbi:MAG: DoxX family protein [Solirubrobacteraceae bacterium]